MNASDFPAIGQLEELPSPAGLIGFHVTRVGAQWYDSVWIIPKGVDPRSSHADRIRGEAMDALVRFVQNDRSDRG